MASKWAANTSHKFLTLADPVLHTYNAHDSYWAGKLGLALLDELHNSRRFPASHAAWLHEVIHPLQGAVMAMQRRGFTVDLPARAKFTASSKAELWATDNAIRREAAKRGFSYTGKFPNSDRQVASLLHDPTYCNLRSHKKTDSGKPSVDQDALLRILRQLRKKDEPCRQLLLDLCHRSRLQTILERYTTFPVDGDGRVRPRVKLAAVKTYRFAYADPALQQFPDEVRSYFVATPGHVLVAADYSQLEARWLAVLASDKPSLEAFAAGRSIHLENAKDFFQYDQAYLDSLTPEALKKVKGSSKSMLYRLQYGGEGAVDKTKAYCPCPRCVDKVPPALELKKPEILAAEARWFAAHPAVRAYHNHLISTTKQRGYYDTPFGVRRYFARSWGRDFERELKNVPMQMNSALLMNRTQVKLHAAGAPIILQHHDSFVLEVPERPGRLVDQWEADLAGTMELPVPEVGGYSFPVETSKGYRWSEL